MNKQTNNIYKNARIKAGLKREPVAEELHIDVRTLDKYESLNGKAPDDIVRQMCILYDNGYLAFQHLKRGPLGEFLPELPDIDFKGATLNMVTELDNAHSIVMEIVKIASDGKVSEFEKEAWAKNSAKLKTLVSTLYAVLLSDK